MPQLVLNITDPSVLLVEHMDTTWVISGLDEPLTADWAARTGDDGAAEAEVAREVGDATIIRIDCHRAAAKRVRIWKGLTSGYEVYVARRPNRDLILADHFRNALALLPVSARAPSDEAIVDHFLVRHVPGRLTYSRTVRRAGHGECLSLDLVTGREESISFDRMISGREIKPMERWIDEIDGALSDVLQPLQRRRGITNMLSGGVDSSLIHSYLGRSIPAITVLPDNATFKMGGTRAAMVGQILGIDWKPVVVSSTEFLTHLEEAIEARGLPPHYPQWVTLTRVFNGPNAGYIVGERADSLFSNEGGRVPMVAIYLSTSVGRLAMPLVHLGARYLKKRGFQLLPAQSESMRRDPLSPRGWASLLTLNTDMDLSEDVFGYEIVERRLQSRLDYIEERAQLLLPKDNRYQRNLETAQWLVFYNEHILLFRHLAFGYGKTLHAPFNTGALVRTALSVPPSHRYSKGTESKYLLNGLLRRRVPAYDTKVRKDLIELPMEDYYASGPLKGIWSKYDVPDFFNGPHRAQLTDRMTQSTWNAITYAIWRKRLADNPKLTPHKASLARGWEIGPSSMRSSCKGIGASSQAPGELRPTNRQKRA